MRLLVLMLVAALLLVPSTGLLPPLRRSSATTAPEPGAEGAVGLPTVPNPPGPPPPDTAGKVQDGPPSAPPILPIRSSDGRSPLLKGEVANELQRASRSLSVGQGPAVGVGFTCRLTPSSSADCSPLSAPKRPALVSASWQNASYSAGVLGTPPASYGGVMAYDAFDGYVVFFGGADGSTRFGQTWIFSNDRWQDETLTIGTAPPPVQWAAMAYDPFYQVVLLYGGCTARACPSNSTWYYTGSSGWTDLTSSLSPASPGLVGASMAFAADPTDDYTVLFGGCTDSGCGNVSKVTYGFTGSGWLAIPTPHTPPAMWGTALAYDPSLGELVLFGGCTPLGCDSGQTWTYLNFDWTNDTAAIAANGLLPAVRGHAVLTWDELDRELILFGGANDVQLFSDTWRLSCAGTSCLWQNLSVPSPAVPALLGAVAPSVSNASLGTMLYGGEGTVAPNFGAGGPFYDSNATYFLDTPITVTATTPPSATARSNVPVSVTASGGSGDYARFAGVYSARWQHNGTVVWGTTANLTFLQPGPYTIDLTVYDRFGVGTADPIPLLATGPNSSIGGGTSAFAGVSRNLTAAPATGGNPPYTYRWTLGDGGQASGASISYAWATVGVYTVTLYLSDVTGVLGRTSETMTVLVLPSVLILASNTTVDLGGTVSFTPIFTGNAAPDHYSWGFGDGSPGSTAATTRHTYARAGVFAVSVNVSDPAGESAVGSLSITVNTVLSATVSASASDLVLGVADTFRAVALGGTPLYHYDWVFGDGKTGSGASITHAFSAASTYTVRAWVNDSAGDTVLRSLSINVSAPSGPGGPGPGGGLLGFDGPAIPLVIVGALGGLVALALWWRRRRALEPDALPPTDE